jgi:isoquinoline 1-oxidoreductase subunit beta
MMGFKRRAFLIGGAVVVGGGAFGIMRTDRLAKGRAVELVQGKGDHSFATWIKIGDDDQITVYSPHADIGQGSNTGLAQMLAEELDADWTKVTVESAPAEPAFANRYIFRAFLPMLARQYLPVLAGASEGIGKAMPDSLMSFVARAANVQITGGSSAIRATGQLAMRTVGAATREALVATAAKRLGVPTAELTTADSIVTHGKSGRSLRYGALAAEAATLSLSETPGLKDRKNFKLIGKPVPRLDIPAKVNGIAKFGIDYAMPDMRVATIMAAPIRGGKLDSVDPAPAMAVKGVEKVIKLETAVVVVASGYWAAVQGLRALEPKFSDGGNGALSTASVFAAHDALRKAGKPSSTSGDGDVDAALAAPGAKIIEANFQVPFLHHAMMEPFALTAHHKDGKLDIWGGLQDPLAAKMEAVSVSGLAADTVTFHPMLIGGSFGRKLPIYVEIVEQVTQLAMQLPYPVKLIWSREEDVQQGAYRPQSSAQLKAALGTDGKITGYLSNYAQPDSCEMDSIFIYNLPTVSRRLFEHVSNQTTGSWRSVNSTQQGFYNESFMDELALAAGVDPVEFRRAHLKPGSRHLAVLNEAARRSNWGAPLPKGTGRGIAIVESFNTIVAHVIEASVKPDGTPKVHKVTSVVDCGLLVNPVAGEAQIMGGIIMGLSAAIGEAITLEKGAVQQSSFPDYPVLQLADAPATIDIHFLETGDVIGGLGEPGVPPAAPALANALFAATGKRVRSLPILTQAMAS